MTLKHETKLYAGPSDLCESISKIILFTVATHFRLPPSIMALSSEDDRLELRAVRGRFCSIRHQRPPRPQSLLSSISPHHLHLIVLELLNTLTTQKTYFIRCVETYFVLLTFHFTILHALKMNYFVCYIIKYCKIWSCTHFFKKKIVIAAAQYAALIFWVKLSTWGVSYKIKHTIEKVMKIFYHSKVCL